MEEKRLRIYLGGVLLFAALCLALPISLSRQIHVESEGPTRLRVGPDHQVRVVAGGRLHVLAGDGSLRASYPLADFGLMSVLSDLIPLPGGDFFAAQAEPPSVWRCNEQSRACRQFLQPDEYLGPDAAALFLAWDESSRRLAVADNFEHRLLLLDGDGKLLDISSRQTLSLSYPQKLRWLGPTELAVVDTSRTRIVGVSLDQDRFGPVAWSDSAALAGSAATYRATRWLDRGPDGSWWTLNSRPDFHGTRVVKITPGAGSPQGFEVPTKEELADLAWLEGRLLLTDVGGWRVRSLDAMGKPGADFGDAAFRAALDAGAGRQAFWIRFRQATQIGAIVSLLAAIGLAWKLTRLQTANAAENSEVRRTETPLAEMPGNSGSEQGIRLEFANDYDYVLNSIRANFSRSWRRILPPLEWIVALSWGLHALILHPPLELLTTVAGGIDLAVFLLLLLTAVGLTPSFQALVFLIRRSPASRVPIIWNIDSRALHCVEGEAFTGHMSWKGIYGVDRLPQGFLVLLNPYQAVWFPFHGFATAEEAEHFERWARRSAPRYRVIRKRQAIEWSLSPLMGPMLFLLVMFLAEAWETGTPLHESFPLLIKPSGWLLTVLAWNTVIAAPLFFLLSYWTEKGWPHVLTGTLLGAALYGLCRYSAWIEPSFAVVVAYALIGAMHWWLVHAGQPR